MGVDERNRARRSLFRELWYTEYPNLGPDGPIRAEFVVGLMTALGDGHDTQTLSNLHAESRLHGDVALVNAREATRDPHRGDPKNTGEKIIAWFRNIIVTHRGTPFFLKADWDTWVHTVRLEHNLRALLAHRGPPMYFGNTLWCSYSIRDYQPCGYGFGPLQASSAKSAECPKLPGGLSAIGPYPYAAGLLWGMTFDLVQWIAGSRLVYDFVINASSRFTPPYWVKGEDSAFGFFAHIASGAPFATLTPMHWGWDVIHDGWEFRGATERGLTTARISPKTIAVHSMHSRADFELARLQLRERCNSTCETAIVPFAVDGLKDLCGRNPTIPTVYAKCEKAGFPKREPADNPLPLPAPRPNCRTRKGKRNAPFVASVAEGGSIECTDEAGQIAQWMTNNGVESSAAAQAAVAALH